MTESMMTSDPKGTLVVRYSSGSYFLTDNMPIEIRNQHLELVDTVTGSENSIELSPGLYSVTAILENGRRDTRPIRIEAAKKISLEFALDPAELFTDQPIAGMRPIKPLRTLRIDDIRWVAGGEMPFDESNSIDSTTFLLATSPGLTIDGADGILSVRYFADSGSLAWIAYVRDRALTWLALPTSAENEETRTCSIHICAMGPPRIELPAQRRVTNALQGMVGTGKVGAALALVQKGAELLFYKYRDPIGAAYGALMLQRFGELGEHVAWMENLARDFAWLRDGQILLASVLAKSDPERGLEVLLAATEAPWTVFSESLSLAASLLRRWPRADDDERCEKRLQELGPWLARCDFGSTYSIMRWSLDRR